jgi:hypothetical protein
MLPHHDPASEELVIGIAGGERGAFVGRQDPADHGTAVRVELTADSRPIERGDSIGRVDGRRGSEAHSAASRFRSARFRSTPHR